ncbi:hypothetical protein JW835_02830 [bacterium]|nr:hypothetical protein [bacterium]
MKNFLRHWYFACMVCLIFSGWTQAETVSKIKGVFYGDYYYNAQNHDVAQKDLNAFSIRRVYFTFENNLTKDIKTRFRLESSHGDFGEKAKINPFVKHAYLEWSNLIPNHKLYLGIAETNAFKNAENLWGYRSVEKTIMDLNKISSSADMGIAMKGDLSESVHHWLTVMNGPGYGSAEKDRFKKVGYAFWLTPAEGLILEGYADYEKQDPNSDNYLVKDLFVSKGYYTMKGLAGLSGMSYSIGLEIFQQTRLKSGLNNPSVVDSVISGTKADVVKSGFSAFGSWMTPIPKLILFARYDWFDANTSDHVATEFDKDVLTVTNGKDNETSLIIAGLDFIPAGNLHVMPNVMIRSYTKEGKDSDMTIRLTLYYKYDTGKILIE